MRQTAQIEFIGRIRTPYKDSAPFQPTGDPTLCKIELHKEYQQGLYLLDEFKYIYVLYWLHRIEPNKSKMLAIPPWSDGMPVGLFASRSPNRPNPIGLSVVQIIDIRGNEIIISSIDVFDNTPLIDIKPYIAKLDSKEDANFGWLDDNGKEHLELHIKGIPHEH